MTRASLYYRDNTAGDGGTWGEMRVSIINRFNRVIKDLSYEEFRRMKGHDQIRLQNLKSITAMGQG